MVVLGEAFWRRRFGGDAGIVGKSLRFGPESYTVVGIVPRSFTGTLTGFTPEIFVPLMMESKFSSFGIQDVTTSPGATKLERRGDRWLFVKGRLKPGVSAEEAQANLDSIMSRLAQAYPDSNRNRSVSVLPATGVRVHPLVDGFIAPGAFVLMLLVGVVLLIACANVANMLMARATSRRREMAVRLAMGASRRRIVRQLLTESLLLSTLGTAVGLIFAGWTLGLLSALDTSLELLVRIDFGFDHRVFAFAAGIAILTGIAFGLAPAIQATRPQLVPALKDETVLLSRRRRFSFGNLLVVGQVAGSLVLLVGAGLLVRSLLASQVVELGFKPGAIALLNVNLKLHGYTEAQGKVFYRSLLERVRALPEVESATLASRVPLSGDRNLEGIHIEGVPSPSDDGIPVEAAQVESDYFKTMGIPLRAGREFTAEDREGAPRVVIVNESMAREFWPGEGALGKAVRTEVNGPLYQVVGISADYKVRTVGEAPHPYLHFARAQDYASFGSLAARGRGAAAPLVAALRREIAALDPNLVLTGALTMDEHVQSSLLPVKAAAFLLAIFAGLAMALAAVGLYGVISYSVSHRTREMGIRMALGAGSVTGLVVREGMTLAVFGVGVGLVVAAIGSHFLTGILYGVRALDPLSFAGASSVLVGIALAANLIPARRASRVDPITALRVQ